MGTVLSLAPRGIGRTGGEALSQMPGWAVPALPEEERWGRGWRGGARGRRVSGRGGWSCVGRGRAASAADLRQPGIHPLRQRCPDSSRGLQPPPGGSMGAEGLPWHTGVTASPPCPTQEPLAFPGLNHSEFCDVFTEEMPVAFPARPQRGSEVPWGCAVPPHRAAHPAQLRARSRDGLEGRRRQDGGKGRAAPSGVRAPSAGTVGVCLELFPSPAAASPG